MSGEARDGVLRTRLRLIGLLAIMGSAVGFLAMGGIGKNLVYYWGPRELLAAGMNAYGATIRLGGLVETGTLRAKPGSTDLDFYVTDGTTSLPVHVVGLPPPMFREGIGVVVEGTYSKTGVFQGRRLMVSHGNEYRAPAPDDQAGVERAIRSTKE